MNLTIEIPDDVAERLAAAGGDLSRRALEALALEEYKRGRLIKPELRRLGGDRGGVDQVSAGGRGHGPAQGA